MININDKQEDKASITIYQSNEAVDSGRVMPTKCKRGSIAQLQKTSMWKGTLVAAWPGLSILDCLSLSIQQRRILVVMKVYMNATERL
jgi:hypothetical protein